MSVKTPDQVGGYDWMLVYDSGDTWEDSGYAYSRTAEGPMNEQEAKLQFSTRPKEERPILYKLVTPDEIEEALRLLDNREKVVGILGDIKTLLTQSQPSSPRDGRVYDGITTALALLQAEKEGGE